MSRWLIFLPLLLSVSCSSKPVSFVDALQQPLQQERQVASSEMPCHEAYGTPAWSSCLWVPLINGSVGSVGGIYIQGSWLPMYGQGSISAQGGSVVVASADSTVNIQFPNGSVKVGKIGAHQFAMDMVQAEVVLDPTFKIKRTDGAPKYSESCSRNALGSCIKYKFEEVSSDLVIGNGSQSLRLVGGSNKQIVSQSPAMCCK